MSLYAEAAAIIRPARKIAVVGHIRPDADAIGSVCATVTALRQLGKDAAGYIGQSHPFADNLLSIPGADEVILSDELPEVDLITTVDCGALDRTGSLAEDIGRRAGATLVIDHHSSNAGFGAVNLIVRDAESTTTILGRLFDVLEVQIDRHIAHCLYAGLLTDTGGFRWGSAAMHTFAAQLMRTGIDIREISTDLLDSGSVADLRMIGQALSRVAVYQAGEHRVAVIVADHDLLASASLSAAEGLVDFVRSLDNTDLGVVFKESAPGLWHASLRSNSVDVSRVAVAMGGGGHIPAAGYTACGNADEVVAALLAQVGR
ncbi:Bifunctional oligoribonuclease and PAP phosphatase NrnA [Corynebacterium atrinae]|uniref:DHH family phosphoesterase n=1 Tax=Corynebacterium atrinae TaxID=1336740 RepID=UPI0025B44449|nr:bifunctional oligoribonuclease/PAP phosphatase NrnA [Corynebacterium atrinae]WJY63656.1 Bifunctional oligoribonuclease and PAP phosphatase NrnA [Corynebacterium atrinae]